MKAAVVHCCLFDLYMVMSKNLKFKEYIYTLKLFEGVMDGEA